ncbi:hypothetical protein [Tissierella carlieri]|nr:hypothetical protein [Tissierella carlieri]
MRELETPAGLFRVLLNEEAIEFEVNEGTYNTYYHNDDIPLHPQGCLEVTIDTCNFKIGDLIICEYEKGKFANDGGGENMYNIVGELEGYTIGMGASDTDDLEYGYEDAKNSLPYGRGKTKFYLPYSNWGSTGRGYEFHIIDDPKLYKNYSNYSKIRSNIIINLVWESNDKDYAWDIVSFLTS